MLSGTPRTSWSIDDENEWAEIRGGAGVTAGLMVSAESFVWGLGQGNGDDGEHLAGGGQYEILGRSPPAQSGDVGRGGAGLASPSTPLVGGGHGGAGMLSGDEHGDGEHLLQEYDQTIDPDMDLVSFDPDDDHLNDFPDGGMRGEKLSRMRHVSHSAQMSGSQEAFPSQEAEPAPEITVAGVLIVVVLSAVLGGANAYLGLFAGITISVSIPSALIALMILRPFNKGVGPLQINVIQTGSSAGSSLAAGVIYTLPALLFLGHWDQFEYLETSIIAAVGGCLGVLFSIPLRRSLVVESPELVFPEGTAIANVLKVIATQNADSRANRRAMLILSAGLLIAGFIKFCDTGLQLWSSYAFGAWFITSSSVIGLGLSLSPALLSVGYIVGLRAGGLMVVGAILNWWLAIPIYTSMQSWPAHATAKEIADYAWAASTRYMGVGSMLIGGIGTVAFLAKPLYRGVVSGIRAWKQIQSHGSESIPRTERDIPLLYVGVAACLAPVVLLLLFWWFLSNWGVAAFAAIFLLFTGFLFSAVGGFMAGLVGSSNNPISGITLCVIIVSSLVLLAFLGSNSTQGPAAAILMGAVIACAAALAGDNMQDLRTGFLLGATPWKQQVMQMVGVLSAAAVLAPVVRLLISAYGIGPPSPSQPNALPAPQATLMWKVAEGVFTLDLPWVFIGIGAGFALLLLIIDFVLMMKHSSFRVPVLAVALGLYLPFELSSAIFLGSVISGFSVWTLSRIEPSKIMRAQYRQYGVFLCAGMITGEALTGILLAVVIVIASNPAVLAFAGPQAGYSTGLLLFLVVSFLLYGVVVWCPLRPFIHEYFGLETD